MRSKLLPLLAFLALGVGLIAVPSAEASYSDSPPQLDQAMLLFVSNARTKWPSEGNYCASAAWGVFEFVKDLHKGWYDSPEGTHFQNRIGRMWVGGPSRLKSICRWLNSTQTGIEVEGAPTVYVESQYEGILKRLNHALATAKCDLIWVTVDSIINAAPVESVSVKVLREAVEFVTPPRC